MSKSQVSTESGQLHSAQWTDARDLIVTKARICTDSSVGGSHRALITKVQTPGVRRAEESRSCVARPLWATTTRQCCFSCIISSFNLYSHRMGKAECLRWPLDNKVVL